MLSQDIQEIKKPSVNIEVSYKQQYNPILSVNPQYTVVIPEASVKSDTMFQNDLPEGSVQPSSNGTSSRTNTIPQSKLASGFGAHASIFAKRQGYPDEIYEMLTEYVQNKENVLDLGCGTGIATKSLIKIFSNVRGCDWDKDMIKEAENNDSGHFDVGSAYDLPYEDGQFGLVTCFGSYHWFCDNEATKEISRVLKPSGYLLVVSGSPGNSKKITGAFSDSQKIIEEVVTDAKIVHPRETYFPIEVLERNGFEIVKTEDVVETKSYTVDDILDVIQTRHMWQYAIQAKKEDVILQKLKEHFESIKDKNGLVYDYMPQFRIVAKKKSKN